MGNRYLVKGLESDPTTNPGMWYQNPSGVWLPVGGDYGDGKAPLGNTIPDVRWGTASGGGASGSTGSFIGAHVYNSADIALTASAWTPLTFNTERYDVGDFHAGSSGQFVIPVTGYYHIGANVAITQNGSGGRGLRILKNGTHVAGPGYPSTGAFPLQLNVSVDLQCTIGDIITFECYTDTSSVSALHLADYSPEAWIHRIDATGGVGSSADSGTFFYADKAPTSPGVTSLLWDSATLPSGALDINLGTSVIDANTTKPRTLTVNSQVAVGWRGKLWALPAGDFTIWSRIRVPSEGNEFCLAGLALSDTTDGSTGHTLMGYGGYHSSFGWSGVTEATNGFSVSGATNPGGTLNNWPRADDFIVILRRVGTNYTIEFTNDGRTVWRSSTIAAATVASGWSPDKFGVAWYRTESDVVLMSFGPVYYQPSGTAQVGGDIVAGGGSSASSAGTFGPTGPRTTPPTSGWSWYNQRGSTIATSSRDGSLHLNVPLGNAGASTVHTARLRAAPTPPYTIIVNMDGPLLATNYVNYGLCFNDGGAELTMWYYGYVDGRIDLYVAPTTGGGQAGSARFGPLTLRAQLTFFAIRDDGTNKKYYVGTEEENMWEVYSEARTTQFTPTQVGFFAGVRQNSYPQRVTLWSWKEQSAAPA